MSPQTKEKFFQLKIALKGSEPPIWRRVIVSSRMTLLDLHDVIQLCMGWEEYHLFIFKVGHLEFVYPPHWEEDAYQYQDAERATLGDLIPQYVPEGKCFKYVYDMGDGWNHEIKVEKIPLETDHKPPYLVAGARACPPEDVGGIGGYAYFLEAINDPQHEEHESYTTWIGGHFDPDYFDSKSINQTFKAYLKERALSRTSAWRAVDNYFSPGKFVSDWTRSITPKHADIAEQLPLRRDIVAMLQYLKNNKVVGTKATGSFPRKHIRGMAEGFVQPFPLDVEIDGKVLFKFAREDEIPELWFLHILANSAGLIHGGENYPWTITEIGEQYLQTDPVAQIWYLTEFWVTQVNWFYQYFREEVEYKMSSRDFIAIIVGLFLGYQPGKEVRTGKLVNDFEEVVPGWRVFQDREISQEVKERFMLQVVITALERLGLIEAVKEEGRFADFWQVIGFKVTVYGQGLLKGVFEAHKRAFARH